MNKASLIQAVHEKLKGKHKEAAAAVDAVLGSITEGVLATGETAVVGFGSFNTKHVAERQGHNPSTGETITIAAKTKVVFKPSAAWQKAVNQ